jgi:hypothetical protein
MSPALTLIAICFLVGFALAARSGYLVLVPATIVALVAACGVGIANDQGIGWLTLACGVYVTSLQAGYLFSVLLRPSLTSVRRFLIKRGLFSTNSSTLPR